MHLNFTLSAVTSFPYLAIVSIFGSHLDLPLKLFQSNSSKLLYRNALSSLLILHSIKTLKTFFYFFYSL